MTLSIIIPVYKVEETLERCIGSIAGQTFQDWEAILVDDGSPDNCPTQCDEWSRRDDRIRVIHKENGGLSDARNAGIAMATGDYITFVDSDDYIGTDTYQLLVDKLQNHPEYDILEFPISKRFADGKDDILTFGECTYNDAKEYWLESKAYLHTYAWNKIYRRELFRDIRFPKGVLFEDAQTLPLILQQAKVVTTTGQGMYYYTQNPQGITALAQGQEWTSLLEAHLRAIKLMNLLDNVSDPAVEELYMHMVDIQIHTYALTGLQPTLPSISIRHAGNNSSLSHKIKLIILKTMGINILCKLYKTLQMTRTRFS